MMTMTNLPRTLTLLALMGLGATGQERTVVQPKDTSAGLANPGLMEADIKGGLIVHVGCGDGKLTASLRKNDSYLVHGLDTSHDSIRQAREHIRSLRLCGKVSVDVFDGKHLPYIDNLANLVVIDSACDVPWAECQRVSAPLGTAMIRKSGNEKLAADVQAPRCGRVRHLQKAVARRYQPVDTLAARPGQQRGGGIAASGDAQALCSGSKTRCGSGTTI